ncbi:MAG: CapA family protein [Planctomycetes bacterium]|nr:CapA family protein [Planctomycetota bacterium]
MRIWIVAGCTLLSLGLLVAGCNENNHYPSSSGTGSSASNNPGDTAQALPPAFSVGLEVRDEAGAPVPGARVKVGTTEFLTDPSGKVTLPNLDQPVLAVIEATGFFPEPVAVGRGDVAQVVSAQLLRRTGPGGERRVVMHFGGDSMLGRRYTDPDEDGLIRVSKTDGGAQAREVVAALAPLFSLADVRALNFESLVADLPASLAYPRKRFLIQSPTATAVPALQHLLANVVNLANNHGYDWEGSGVIATLGALDSAGIPHFGVGTSEAEAGAALTTTAGGLKIGFLGYTTVNGDFINDALPTDAASVPSNLSLEEAWKYEQRSFGFSQGSVAIAVSPRRAGEVWRLFKAEEDGGLSGAVLDAFWAQVRMTYPELQDLVARRGHGGTNAFSPAKVAADVAALRASGHDLVVVQLHGGFEYAEQKSQVVERASHDAIDAGADLYVGHHPHVLNGVELYKGKLVVHSLGNFFFDQNFFVTFASVMLRVVFQEGTLLQARLYPLTIDDYRTAPLVNEAADYTLRLLSERSEVPARAERGSDRAVRYVVRPRDPNVVIPEFVREHNTARLIAPVTSATRVAVSLQPAEVADLPGAALTRSRGPAGESLGLELGRDLYGWGHFEDLTADGIADGETHWILNQSTRRVEALAGAPDGFSVLRVRRLQTSTQNVAVTPVARAPLLRVRLYTESGGSYTPASDPARYSLRFKYRLSGLAPVRLSVKLYTFLDPDPFLLPDAKFLREDALAFTPIADDAWHEAVVEIPDATFAPDPEGNFPVFALPILNLDPASTPEALLFVDSFQFLEWHTADTLPDGFYGVDAVRPVGGGPRNATLEQK